MGMPLLGLLIFTVLIVVPVWLFARASQSNDMRLRPIRVMTADPRPWDADRARRHGGF
ncbi:MAG: hypothetical protein ABI630_09580 [Betaproteobacteria bacterium]